MRRSSWGQPADASAEALLYDKGAWSDMHRFAAAADIIIVACSQDRTSMGFVNDGLLAACKPGVIIVNVARGALPASQFTLCFSGFLSAHFLGAVPTYQPLVMVPGGLLDYSAVLAGLESCHIGGLGLDVHWTEPFDPQDWIAEHPR